MLPLEVKYPALPYPHAVSAKIWGCQGIIAYDAHFGAIPDMLEHVTEPIADEDY